MIDHASRSHKRFAASAADRWMLCPGSIRLCESIPEPPPTKYALEGTLAHEWLQYKMVGGAKPKEEATPEMLEAIAELKKIVAVLYIGLRSPTHMKLEETVTFSRHKEVGGTLDISVYCEFLKHLWIFDFKFGAGVVVSANNNRQMRIYAQGAIDTFGWGPLRITSTIFQPRAFSPEGRTRSETFDRAELLDFETEVQEAIEKCLEPDAPLIPGEKQCKFCPAATICPAREKQALVALGSSYNHVQQVSRDSLPAASTMTPERIGGVLAVKKMVVDWFDEIAQEGWKLAMQGVSIPGHKLVAARGRREWSGDIDATATELARLVGGVRETFIDRSLIGVTTAEKIIKAEARDRTKALEKFAFLTTKKSNGALQLVSESDSRPAAQPASQAFDGVIQIPYVEAEEQ